MVALYFCLEKDSPVRSSGVESRSHNLVFDRLDVLEDHLEASLPALETNPHRIRPIVA